MIALETERLIVNNFRSDDWEDLRNIIVRYEDFELSIYDHQWPTSPEEIKQITAWFASGDNYLAVRLKNTDQCIGLIALNQESAEGTDSFDLGYIFDFDQHGKGYATEACRAVLRHAFVHLQAQRLVSGTAAANRASCRLLERLGFEKIAEGPASFRSAPDGTPISFVGYKYALLREQWQSGS